MVNQPEELRFQELDHTADIGVMVQGKTIAELFANAGFALFAMIADLRTVEERCSCPVSVQGEDWSSLMHEWLRTLLGFFTLQEYIFRRFEIQEIAPYHLSAKVWGEQFSLEKHVFYTEIKGVTYHQLSVQQQDGGWESQIIFDV